MTDAEAINGLGADLISALSECWKTSWDEYLSRFADPDESARFRTQVLQERATVHAKRTLPKFGIRCYQESEQAMFELPGVAILVFKKLDSDYRFCQNETGRAARLYQGELLPNLPLLLVGMVPDANFFGFEKILLCRPRKNGGMHSWVREITEGAVTSSSQSVIPIIEQEIKEDSASNKRKKRYWNKNNGTPDPSAQGPNDSNSDDQEPGTAGVVA